MLVSLAGKIHDARSIGSDLARTGHDPAFWSHFDAARDDQLWYDRELLSL